MLCPELKSSTFVNFASKTVRWGYIQDLSKEKHKRWQVLITEDRLEKETMSSI